MTDDILREKLKSITDNHSCYGCYDEMKSQRRKCPGLQRDLLELVHQYAQAYAESIIDVETTSLTHTGAGAKSDLKRKQRTLNNEKKGKL